MGLRKHLGEGLRFVEPPCASPDCGAETGRLGGIIKGGRHDRLQVHTLKARLTLASVAVAASEDAPV